MKKICILTDRIDLTKILLNHFKDTDITIFSNKIEELETNFDLSIVINYKYDIPQKLFNSKVIKVHPSLLPAFANNTAIKDAYLAGVKVTGVTICELNNNNTFGRIITQYPILIDNYTHYDQLEEQINELEKKLLPPVVKSILEDKIFDIVDFLNDTPEHNCGGCGGSCSNCKGCH